MKKKGACDVLTLREPLRLKSAQLVLAGSFDSFGERLRGNYGLLCAHISPKELLLLFTAPPELPEGLGGTTTLAVQNNLTDESRMSLQIVNQVVNRILLSQTTRFTYQDSVYITSVLERLGITDATQFMRQVHELREENKSIHQLTALYENNLTLIQALSQNLQPPPSALPKATEQAPPSPHGERYTLQNSIYRRLRTGDLYREVTLFQTNPFTANQAFHRAEFHLAEQFRVSSLLRLSELKNQTNLNAPLLFSHHSSYYEQGSSLPPPKNELQALARLAAATLLNAVDRSLTLTLQNHLHKAGDWFDLRTAAGEAGHSTLIRCERWHSAPSAEAAQFSTVKSESLNRLYHAEYSLLSRLLSETKKADYAQYRAGDFYRTSTSQALSFTHREETNVTEQALPAVPEASAKAPKQSLPPLTQLTQQMLLGPVRSAAPPQTPLPAANAPKGAVRQRERGHRESLAQRQQLTQRLFEVILAQRQAEAHAGNLSAAPAEPPPAPSHTPHTEQTFAQASAAVNRLLQSTSHWEHTVSQESEQILQTETEHLDGVSERLETQRLTEQATSASLRERLDRVDEHNREMLRQVRESRLMQVSAPPTRKADPKQVMSDALRALDTPEKVLREVFEQPDAAPPKAHTPPQAELLLAQADEPTRKRLEAALLYEHGTPQGGSALLKPASVALLSRELAHAQQSGEAPVFEHRARAAQESGQSLREAAQSTAARMAAAAPTVGGADEYRFFRAPLAFVYKQEQQSFSEELLKKLESRQTVTEQTAQTQTIRRDTTQITELEQQNRQAFRQTTEDVSELVRQTLARQMGSLSDKLYSQMEKRLRTERARRGR